MFIIVVIKCFNTQINLYYLELMIINNLIIRIRNNVYVSLSCINLHYIYLFKLIFNL